MAEEELKCPSCALIRDEYDNESEEQHFNRLLEHALPLADQIANNILCQHSIPTGMAVLALMLRNLDANEPGARKAFNDMVDLLETVMFAADTKTAGSA